MAQNNTASAEYDPDQFFPNIDYNSEEHQQLLRAVEIGEDLPENLVNSPIHQAIINAANAEVKSKDGADSGKSY